MKHSVNIQISTVNYGNSSRIRRDLQDGHQIVITFVFLRASYPSHSSCGVPWIQQWRSDLSFTASWHHWSKRQRPNALDNLKCHQQRQRFRLPCHARRSSLKPGQDDERHEFSVSDFSVREGHDNQGKRTVSDRGNSNGSRRDLCERLRNLRHDLKRRWARRCSALSRMAAIDGLSLTLLWVHPRQVHSWRKVRRARQRKDLVMMDVTRWNRHPHCHWKSSTSAYQAPRPFRCQLEVVVSLRLASWLSSKWTLTPDTHDLTSFRHDKRRLLTVLSLDPPEIVTRRAPSFIVRETSTSKWVFASRSYRLRYWLGTWFWSFMQRARSLIVLDPKFVKSSPPAVSEADVWKSEVFHVTWSHTVETRLGSILFLHAGDHWQRAVPVNRHQDIKPFKLINLKESQSWNSQSSRNEALCSTSFVENWQYDSWDLSQIRLKRSRWRSWTVIRCSLLLALFLSTVRAQVNSRRITEVTSSLARDLSIIGAWNLDLCFSCRVFQCSLSFDSVLLPCEDPISMDTTSSYVFFWERSEGDYTQRRWTETYEDRAILYK